MTFKTLYRAGIVKRWHTNLTLKEQSIAEHQWAVAMICTELRPGNLPLLSAALVHDLGESITGDLPYMGKRLFPPLKTTSEIAERRFATRHELVHIDVLSPENQHCLKWADMFEALLFAQREVALGNQFMIEVVRNAREALDTIGFPNQRAKELLDEFTA